MAPLAVIAFQIGVKQVNDETGMRYVIIFYSALTILCGLMVFFKMNNEKIGGSERISFGDIGKVLRLPAVWIIGIVTFCNYVFTLSLYYFTPYATGILGATVTFGATLAAVKRFICPISNVGGGYLADKVGTGNLLLVSFIIMAAGTAGILFLPASSSMIAVFTVLFLVIYFFYNVNYAMTWAMMDEGKIPEKYSGTAAGVISTVGYLPEIFCSLLAGILIDGFPGITGFRYFFGFLIVMLVIGAGFVLVWKNYLKRAEEE
ncbi:MAG: MFS transporter [Aminipila sp.]